MSKVDSIKVNIRIHEALFFACVLLTIMMILWIASNYQTAATAQWILVAIVISLSTGFSIWGYRRVKRFINDLEDA